MNELRNAGVNKKTPFPHPELTWKDCPSVLPSPQASSNDYLDSWAEIGQPLNEV